MSRCDECWKPHMECRCVTYEGVHGHAYGYGRHTPESSLRDWYGDDIFISHKTWWGWSLKAAKEESERLAQRLPGSPAHRAWRKHYLVLRNDLSRLGYVYDFAPITRPTPR